MSKSIFHPDSGLMITMGQITDCIFLSLFWLLCCIPVLTIGAATAALYDSVSRGVRTGDKHSWQRFFSSFRANLLPGLLPSALFAAAVSLLAKAMVTLWNAAVLEGLSWAVFAGGGLLGMLVLGILSLMFPMLSRFQNTTGGLLKNTVLLGLANAPRTLALGILNGLFAWMCLLWVVPLTFLPALGCMLGSFLIEPMFRPWMPEPEGDAA